MSATLGAMLKRLGPSLRIQLYEVTEELAQESSNGWNNAGTGHAGICELSYTPNREADGSVNVSKAVFMPWPTAWPTIPGNSSVQSRI